MSAAFSARYAQYRDRVERELESLFAVADAPCGRLQEAMRYSLLAGGKRVRPVLTLAFCELFGGDAERALPLACALECVHTYSLIHDDLPCMDDDDVRRGRPACHVRFGEALALLAGDALLTEAFSLAAGARDLSAAQRAEAVRVLSGAAGASGMVAGQTLDLFGPKDSISEVKQLDRLKTGALFRAAGLLGCVAAGADLSARERAAVFSAHLGLAFQARDDLLDAPGSGPGNLAALLGEAGCQALVEEESRRAGEALEDLPGGDFLMELARRLAARGE